MWDVGCDRNIFNCLSIYFVNEPVVREHLL